MNFYIKIYHLIKNIMSTKKIEEILSEVKELKSIQKKHEITMNTLSTVLFEIQKKVSDLSSKVDMDISTLNITTVNNSTKTVSKTVKAPVKNIMTYFKFKYNEDPSSLNEIVSEKEIKELFEKHKKEIDARKGNKLDIFKGTLIYKHLIKDNKGKTALLRSMKECEELENTPIEKEITNTEVQELIEDDIEDEPKHESSDEDSD